MMMMCETRQMSSNPESMAQLEEMVKRYRNSPSVILWSIGNEEWQLQNAMSDQGARIGADMARRCHELDPTRVVSAAVNGDNEKGVSTALDIIGFNYNLKFPDKYHAGHPKMACYGSETSSAIGTRGIYSTDKLRNWVNSYDGVVPWGETAEEWWKFYGTRDWLAGGFAWTGFDYRGEPTPYKWPSINSQFGIVDMCGFPKDNFFYYKAWWGKEPSLHLFPHWNWEGREGEEIAVWVYSNADEVELFVNGKSQGSQKVPQLGHVQWKVRYEPGSIEARGSKDGKVILTEKREPTGAASQIRLTPDRTEINADGEDVVSDQGGGARQGRPPRPERGQPAFLQRIRCGPAHRRRQRRSQLPGERQGSEALTFQRPCADRRPGHQARGRDSHRGGQRSRGVGRSGTDARQADDHYATGGTASRGPRPRQPRVARM